MKMLAAAFIAGVCLCLGSLAWAESCIDRCDRECPSVTKAGCVAACPFDCPPHCCGCKSDKDGCDHGGCPTCTCSSPPCAETPAESAPCPPALGKHHSCEWRCNNECDPVQNTPADIIKCVSDCLEGKGFKCSHCPGGCKK